MKYFNQILSVIFHPIFSALIIFNFGLVIGYNDSLLNHFYWSIILFFFTVFCPIVILFILKKIKLINSFEMKTHKERVIPLLSSIFFILLGFYFLEKTTTPIYLLLTYLGGIVLIFTVSVISYFYKISAHLSGLGGVYGSILFYSILFNVNCNLILLLILLLSVLVALARFALKAHSLLQLVLGFLLGNLIMILLNFVFYV